MKIQSKDDAQRRIDQINYFESELTLLKKHNILSLTQEQLSNIKTYHQDITTTLSREYDIDRSAKAKNLSLGLKVVSFITALALSASLFFMFYQFWGYLESYTQSVILVASSLIALSATYLLYHRDKSGYFTKILALISVVTFVLNISMLGSIYNIMPSPNALALFALFAFTLAYASNTRLLLAFAIIFLTSFLSAQIGTWSGLYWIYFGKHPENFFLPALILFLIPYFNPHKRFYGFDTIYRVFAMIIFFIPLLILSNYGGASYLDASHASIEAFYQIVGFGVSLGAIWLGVYKGWSDLLNTGNIFFTLFLYTKFYDWFWAYMPKFLFFFIVGMVTLGMMMIFKRIRDRLEESV
jgi:hypothetical protein